MPEYLAPGVYVEEVELGPRPLEGVSTSTTGFVGLSLRGPVNKPTLVTNYGEFERFFGGYLPDDYEERRWLAYAVQGYFTNGGARGYIVRTAPLPQTEEDFGDRDQFAHVASTVLANQQQARRSLSRAVRSGDTTIYLAYAAGLPVDTAILVGEGQSAEVVRVTGFTDGVTVAPPFTRAHSAGRSVTEMETSEDADTTLDGQAPNTEGATSIRVAQRTGLVADRWVRIDEEDDQEFVQLAAVPGGSGAAHLTTRQPLRAAHPRGTPVAQAEATGAAATTLGAAVTADATEITLSAEGGLIGGDLVVLEGANAGQHEVVRITETPTAGDLVVPIEQPARFGHDSGADVTPLAFGADPVDTTLVPGLHLDGALDVSANDWILVGGGDDREFARVLGPPGDDDGVTLDRDLQNPQPNGAEVRRVSLPELASSLAEATRVGATELRLDAEDAVQAGDVIEILDGAQTEYADVLDVDDDTATLGRALRYAHAGGVAVRRLGGSIRVHAGPMTPDPELYPEVGVWGNDIKLTVEASSRLTTEGSAVQGDPFVELTTANGVEPGTVLRFPQNTYAVVNRVEGKRVFLEGGAPAALDPNAPEDELWRRRVSTQEFKLTVTYGDRDEVFDGLSMDRRHDGYFERVINRDSQLIHVEPVTVAAQPPENMPLAGVRWPGGGSDGIGGFTASTYIGEDSDDADRRTGLFAMLNAARVSIVAVPGITEDAVQLALISHCERTKYRFAVLDSEDRATLDQVQRQRSLYDTKYAALYYPWLKVFDPLTSEPIYVPPSGHIAGLYARTDQEVGVHKAPANAVLRDVLDLQFTVGKGQQDVLNPQGINAIRAFPGRGIRVWGARTVSSDSLWRYINVRRLFNFLEQSIDEGTQYAVFEPNDLPLWNRLKASITAFLTVVWRSGALQGATAEEAFFVKCGLGETMIQADIDAGQVIMVIGVAPVKPAEFVIFRIGQKAGGASA